MATEGPTAQGLPGEGIEPVPILSPQAGFLITNALRFMFKAPGVTSWQYTLLQLQVNGMLPILPLLFPVLWVLATACGEARVLAQMSKASPSSLVGCPGASREQWQRQKQLADCANKWSTGLVPPCF